MRKVLSSLLVVYGTCWTGSAWGACVRLEAEMVARAQSVAFFDDHFCHVEVRWDRARSYFRQDEKCPLVPEEVLKFGVMVYKSRSSFSCDIQPGDVLSGVVWKALQGDDPNIYFY